MRISRITTRFAGWALVPVLAAAVVLPATYAQDNRGRGHGPAHSQSFRFRQQDRSHFQRYYSKDASRWRRNSHGRPHFYAGYHIPPSYAIQAVPPSYYSGMPAPPPGYAYGYYDGYVVAYNPTTRIISDVIDLVSAATAR